MSLEEFLAMLRFEQRYRLAEFEYRDMLKKKSFEFLIYKK